MVESQNPIANKGMSLIEVMIVLTVISLIGLGITSLMRNMLQIQRRSETANNLQTFATNLKSILQNDTAWAQTINLNGTGANQVGCMDDDTATSCNHDPAPGTPVNQIDVINPPAPAGTLDFVIYNENGAQFYDPTGATNGFDLNGQPCGTYDGAAGNDACPFRYDITWYADCPNATPTCNKPRVTIVASFRNNPNSKGDPTFRLNTQDLSFALRRGEKVRHQPIRISYEVKGNAVNFAHPTAAVGVGGGRCVNGAETLRPLNTLDDPDGSVLNNIAASIIQLDTGRYECNITAQAFQAINGFKIILHDMTNNERMEVGAAFSGEGATATVNGSVNFEISAPTNFRLLHLSNSCDIWPFGDSASPPQITDDFAMGIPSPDSFGGAPAIPSDYDGTFNVYTDISCIRSS